MQKIKYVLLSITLLLTSCYSERNDMSLSNLKCVETFKTDVKLLKAEAKVFTKSLGVGFKIENGFFIEDVVSTLGLWHVTDMKTGVEKYLFKKGNGPGEYIFSPNVYDATFVATDSGFVAYTRDYGTGSIYKTTFWRIDNDFEYEHVFVARLLNGVTASVAIDDSTQFFRILSHDMCHMDRYLCVNGELKPVDFLSRLNSASVTKGQDFNIISSGLCYNDKKDIIMEIPLCLNVLNLYSLDGKYQQAVCYGKEPFSIEDIEKVNPEERIFTFENNRMYNDYVAVLWVNEQAKVYISGGRKNSEILLFSYDGEGVARYSFDFLVISFEMDPFENKLYVRGEDDENIYVFQL